jgi:tRNA-specific 2-thiouridylase
MRAMKKRVLVAMSGGVDSSVAAALLRDAGHDVVGVTMKLWGGESDSGCCSVADVEDARRVAQQLGIPHHVFNFTDDFDRDVVAPYVSAHAVGQTPNPCVACNRHLKFDRLLTRAWQLGFDAAATGHHARVATDREGRYQLRRGADQAKDQSYVLHMLDQSQLARILLPVGELTKAEVRSQAAALSLRTAAKPDSQDVCFITRRGGREAFLGDRIPLHPGRLVDSESGEELGTVPAVELVTVGQRRGMRVGVTAAGAERRYALDVDVATGNVTVGPLDGLLIDRIVLRQISWVDRPVPPGTAVEVQMSAHGCPVGGVIGEGDDAQLALTLVERQRRVAPGQSVVLYHGDAVLGGGVAS